MFNQLGLYFLAYANKTEVDVGHSLGTTGGPQVWDFTSGPEDVICRLEVVTPSEGANATLFPLAKFAEQKTDQSDGSRAWMYLDQVPGSGRINYGFHDAAVSGTHPSSNFNPPIRDFPERIGYGDSWTTRMEFESELVIPNLRPDGGEFTTPIRITYSSTAIVDAFGTLNQPGLGWRECLRVNELAQYDIALDRGLGDGYQTVSTQYIRSFYWLGKGRGIAVQVTSRQQDTPPIDDFHLATAFIRMFETNHPDSPPPTPGIMGFNITLNPQGAQLTWTKATGIASYRIEYTPSLAPPISWMVLHTTAANLVVDDDAGSPQAPTRFYRVVGLE
jgi:hypothetical protein